MKNQNITLRLIIMNFLEFAVWGAYLTSMGSFQISMKPGRQGSQLLQGLVLPVGLRFSSKSQTCLRRQSLQILSVPSEST